MRPATYASACARAGRTPIPEDAEAAARAVTVGDAPPGTLDGFLALFRPFHGLWRDEETIRRVAVEAVEDAAAEGCTLLELRFSPVHFARGGGFDPADTAAWICDAAEEEAQRQGLRVTFTATLGRDFGVEGNRGTWSLLDHAVGDRFAGLDLAGTEDALPAAAFAEVIGRWRAAGRGITIHAGEGAGPESVRDALAVGADRLGHGVRAAEDPDLVAELADRGTVLEVCPVSNLHTGTVPRLEDHPLERLLDAGVRAVLATDDPAVSVTDLAAQWRAAAGPMGLDDDMLRRLWLEPARAAFGLDDAERRDMKDALQRGWTAFSDGTRA